MSKITQLNPNRIHGMIEALEANKDNIESLVVSFIDKDGVISSGTACHSYVEAKGMVSILDENLTCQAQNDEFEPI